MEEAKQDLCTWCGKWYTGKCQPCDLEIWRSNRRNGCFMTVILFPLVIAGFFIGLIYSGLKAGFDEGKDAWKISRHFFRAPRPK